MKKMRHLTWIKLVRMRIMREVKRIGPRKLKSLPFFAAQKVYAVREQTTAEVRINASSTILPENISMQDNNQIIIIKAVHEVANNQWTIKCPNRIRKRYRPSILAQLAPTKRLSETVKRPRIIRFTGCFWWYTCKGHNTARKITLIKRTKFQETSKFTILLQVNPLEFHVSHLSFKKLFFFYLNSLCHEKFIKKYIF